jgi:hypothetical protein
MQDAYGAHIAPSQVHQNDFALNFVEGRSADEVAARFLRDEGFIG